MPVPFFHVDAFADQPFAGNPAAVCLLPGPRDPGWMQKLASEMNLSETAFVEPRDDGFGLRWFTPTVEVDLCGHATLASAHVLWKEGRLKSSEPARFHTRSGLLTVKQSGDLIEMDFPARPATPCPEPKGLCELLGLAASMVAVNGMDYLVVTEEEERLRQARPDFARLAQFPGRGIILTSPSRDRAFDFVSRFFAPASGIDEDPVTGSAHCCLGPYWAARLGKSDLVGFQASARGGVVRVGVRGDRVLLAGRAVLVIRGELCE